MNKKTLKSKGFTLVEVVVVIAIIAILSLLIIGAITVARNTATEATNRQNGHTIRLALEAHHARHGVYCATTATTGQITCLTAPATIDFQTLASQLSAPAVGFTATLRPTAGTILGGGRFITLQPQSASYQSANAAGAALVSQVFTLP